MGELQHTCTRTCSSVGVESLGPSGGTAPSWIINDNRLATPLSNREPDRPAADGSRAAHRISSSWLRSATAVGQHVPRPGQPDHERPHEPDPLCGVVGRDGASFGATCVANTCRIVSAAVGLVIAARSNATKVVSSSQTAKKLGNNASATHRGRPWSGRAGRA